MDENEFRQLINLFPVVRSPDYHAESDIARQSSSSAPNGELKKDWQDTRTTDHKYEAFWGKLKVAAEQKVGAADAERFCKAFQQVYNKLVYEELTTDDARRIIGSTTS